MHTNKFLKIKDYDIVGSSNRCLILNMHEERVYCSTRNYFLLANDPTIMWDIVERPVHSSHKSGREIQFPAQKWLVTYRPAFL